MKLRVHVEVRDHADVPVAQQVVQFQYGTGVGAQERRLRFRERPKRGQGVASDAQGRKGGGCDGSGQRNLLRECRTGSRTLRVGSKRCLVSLCVRAI